MPYKSLNDFIQTLIHEDEIRVIEQFVNPELEIAEIADRMSKTPGGGKALLFINNGTSFPLLINSFGSWRRMCLALGSDNLDDIGLRIKSLMDFLLASEPGFLSRIKLLPRLSEIASFMPRLIKGRGACQEVILKDPDLSLFPILKCWPYDGGRFITLPMVHSIDPNTGIRNVGMYRMQVLGPKDTAMHWHRHKTGARHFEEYKKTGKQMPIAVALGGDPVYAYSASAPLPDQIDEYIFAGFIRKKKVNLVKCISQDIDVPADADIVIEGFIDPYEEFVLEGPFGDHTGFYSLADMYPRFHVTCITHRTDAVYPATIVGIPPQEDAWIARATEKIFLFPIRLALVPELLDLHMPDFGVAHNLAIIKISKTYPGQAIKVMNALWGAGQMMFNKVMIVTDCETRLSDYPALINYLAAHVNIHSDLHFSSGPLDMLDHSANSTGFGGKLGIDATRKLPEEVLSCEDSISGTKPSLDLTVSFRNNSIVAGINKMPVGNGMDALFVALSDTEITRDEILKQIFQTNDLSAVGLIFLVNAQVNLKDIPYLLWYCLNNIDPRRDCFIKQNPCGVISLLIIDGRRKRKGKENFERDWPNIIISDEKTISRIDDVWGKLKIGNFIDSPSHRFRRMVGNDGAVAK